MLQGIDIKDITVDLNPLETIIKDGTPVYFEVFLKEYLSYM
jgi:hypothetical protein